MKILLFQAYDRDIVSYSKYTAALNSAYCAKHGYSYMMEHCVKQAEFAPAWYKISLAINYARSGSYDYLVFLDSDIAVLNDEITVESKISQMKGGIAFSANGILGGNPINAGAFIMRCGAAEIEFFADVIEAAHNEFPKLKKELWCEQEVISNLYTREKYAGLIDVFELDFINSYFKINYHAQHVVNEQFVFHFCNRNRTQKTEVAMDVFFSRLPYVYENLPNPAHELNRNQMGVLTWQSKEDAQKNYLYFTKLNDLEWKEINEQKKIYYWTEENIQAEYMQLTDLSRNMHVRIYNSYCEVSTNGKDFSFFRHGQWLAVGD